MSLELIKREAQPDGQFNGGAILEKRPVVLSRSHPVSNPYSNLFYWAHAWSDKGSTIGEHPHQGFEILSFVIKGAIEHYDSAGKIWKKLNEGDAQIIRSGSGISHSEKIMPGSHMFQVWFDPGINQSIHKAATYSDYASSSFPLIKENGCTRKVFKGNDSPLMMDSDAEINDINFSAANCFLPIDPDKIYSILVIEGTALVNNCRVSEGDFLKITDEKQIAVEGNGNFRLFSIATPAVVPYNTYISIQGL
jgi:quercetin 2,3-dioxygenase